MLSALGDSVNFSYFPLNHLTPNGSFDCSSAELDCPSTIFDSCLSHAVSDPTGPLLPGTTRDRQLALSGYLACFEGPFANREELTNASARHPCFREHFGADPAPWNTVSACAADPRLYIPVLEELNATRAPMYARLGKVPGLFPHIFVDGLHQWNNSWTALFRTLCERLPSVSAPDACTSRRVDIGFRLATRGTPPLTPDGIARQNETFAAAVLEAVNLAASRILFPTNWETSGAAGQADGAPSYVNAQPAWHPQLLMPLPGPPDPDPTLNMTVRIDVIGAFEPAILRLGDGGAVDLMQWALRSHGFKSLLPGDISHVTAEPVGRHFDS
mmetsp:Transcript_48309/g.108835  ORF Transcript_48309/g.108835 Transcript_48309/m.108835 type:complete len:329 (-) Transcript_48309:366-1352(-)